jgi:hypothetical protein
MVLLRKTITISMNLFGQTEYNIPVHDVPFNPDEVILRSVSSCNTDDAGAIFVFYSMWSNLINETLFSQAHPINTSSNQSYEVHFPLNGRPVQGSYQFKVLDENKDAIPAAAIRCSVSFQLEFIKYSDQ